MWQTIETAPKDGTHILAYPVLLDVACVVSWHGKGQAGYWRLPMTDRIAPYRPTVWMPVPKPSTYDLPDTELPRQDIMDGRGRRDMFRNPKTT